jgi:hypothetical protein
MISTMRWIKLLLANFLVKLILVAVGNSGAPSPKRQRVEQSNIVTEENSSRCNSLTTERE